MWCSWCVVDSLKSKACHISFEHIKKKIGAATYRNNDYITEINISVRKEGEEYERNPNVMMFERMPRVGHAWKIKHIIDILQINITYHKFGINGSRIR